MGRRNVFISLGLVMVIAAVYWPVWHFEFINYDDGLYVAENHHVQSGLTWKGIAWAFTSFHFSLWMPVTWLSCMLDCQLFGLRAGGHHLVNVLFHIANSLLLFAALNRMTAAVWRSALVAALFALHPLHVESVAWVAERKDVLSTFFWMLTLLAYVHHVERPSPARYLLTLGLYALGLMAKPMLVTLPFVLLLLDYWPLGRTPWVRSATGTRVAYPARRLLLEKLPFLGLAVLVSAVTVWAEHRGGSLLSFDHLPLGARAANALISYARYLGKTFWPVGLAAYYPYQTWPPAAVGGAAAMLTGVTATVLWRRRAQPHLVTGWLWYLGTLLPVIGLVQVGTFSLADRYTYVPLIGVFSAVAWSLPRHRAAAAVCALLLVCCAALSATLVRHWANSETVFRHALTVTHNNHVAHENLGKTCAEHGRLREATIEFAAALRIKPTSATGHVNLGNALAAQGKFPEAMSEFQAALRIRPGLADAHYNLGVALASQARLAEAISEFSTARQLDPDHAEAHYNLGALLADQGRISEAIAEYRDALRLKPNWTLPLRGLVWILATNPEARFRNGSDAVQLAERLRAVTADEQPDALDALAAAYAEAARFNDAVSTAQQAVELANASGQSDLSARIRERLKLYQAGRAYRAGLAAR